MTTFRPKTQKCYVCGNESTQRIISNTNRFGSPDLDLRPPEMERSTMPYWVTVCPSCGYAARDLSDETGVSAEWLRSESYISCDGISFESVLAKIFYRRYLISTRDGKMKDAFFTLLYAAWSCDDAQDDTNAIRCRELALSLIDTLIETDGDYRNTFLLIKADLLRRAGLFDRLAEEFASFTCEKERTQRIIQFQLQKAKEKDARCYRISDAVPEDRD